MIAKADYLMGQDPSKGYLQRKHNTMVGSGIFTGWWIQIDKRSTTDRSDNPRAFIVGYGDEDPATIGDDRAFRLRHQAEKCLAQLARERLHAT